MGPGPLKNCAKAPLLSAAVCLHRLLRNGAPPRTHRQILHFHTQARGRCSVLAFLKARVYRRRGLCKRVKSSRGVRNTCARSYALYSLRARAPERHADAP